MSTRRTEFAVKDGYGRLSDYTLWLDMLDADELPDKTTVKLPRDRRRDALRRTLDRARLPHRTALAAALRAGVRAQRRAALAAFDAAAKRK